MSNCIQREKIERERYSRLTDLMNLFDGKTIKDIDGREVENSKVLQKYYGSTESAFGNKMFSEIVYRSTYKPYSAYETFTDGDFRRIKNEILKEANNIENPKLSFLERFGFVKRGVMRKHAVSNWLNKKINDVTGYERVKYARFLLYNRDIAKILRQEVVDRGAQKWWQPGIKGIRNIDKLERELFGLYNKIAYSRKRNEDTSDLQERADTIRNNIQIAMEKEGGGVIGEFAEYLQTKPEADGLVYRTMKVDGVDKSVPYGTAIQRAGSQARKLLNEMGGVLIDGLNSHKKVVTEAFMFKEKMGDADKLTPVGRRLLKYYEKVNEEIKGIRDGIEASNYFPHYLMEGMVKIEGISKDIEAANYKESERKENKNWSESEVNQHLETLEYILSEMRENINKSPDRAKHKSKRAFDNWMQNPLAVIKKYGYDAIAFNKNQNLKQHYIKAQKHMGTMSGESLEAMRKYVRDVYTMAEKGYGDRPNWVNNSIRTVTAAEFLSKIGLGVGTGVRNMFSGMYFIQGLGNRNFIRYLRDWADPKNKELVKEIVQLEKESGFVFRDLAQELYTEGLVPTKGVRVSDVDMKVDPETGKARFSYKQGKVWKYLDAGMTWTTQQAAIIQRVTENILRKHMFRASYMIKRKELEKIGTDVGTARTISRMFALDMVNKYAFEYAAHQKAPIAGGDPGALGGTGQVVFQFMHYPMSFLQQQSEILRNSKSAIEAKQWNNPDTYIPMKFAALYGLTQLLSGVFNKDLNRIMENDTIDRIKNIYDVLNGDEEVMGRGYVGPAVGDLFFYATLYDLIKMPENEFVNLVVGYNDANKLTDQQKTSRIWSTLNVEVSKWKNKMIPEIMSGKSTNLLMHELGTYPRKWTKDMHQYIFGKHSKVRSSGRKKSGKSKYTPPSYIRQKNLSSYKKREISPSSASRRAPLEALNRIQRAGPASKYSKFEKRNLLTAIDMIDKQREEEKDIYKAENNRKMIMT